MFIDFLYRRQTCRYIIGWETSNTRQSPGRTVRKYHSVTNSALPSQDTNSMEPFSKALTVDQSSAADEHYKLGKRISSCDLRSIGLPEALDSKPLVNRMTSFNNSINLFFEGGYCTCELDQGDSSRLLLAGEHYEHKDVIDIVPFADSAVLFLSSPAKQHIEFWGQSHRLNMTDLSCPLGGTPLVMQTSLEKSRRLVNLYFSSTAPTRSAD